MFSDVLLTVDFDRTLTAPDGSIPQRNLDAIRYFIDNSGTFTVNTGRTVNTMRKRMGDIPVNAPLLLYNGSAAYENGQLTRCKPIDLDVWETAAAIHRQFPEMNLEIQAPKTHYLYDVDPMYEKLYDALSWQHETAVPGQDIGPFLKLALFGTVKDMTLSQMFEGTPEELAQIDQAERWINETYAGKVVTYRAAPRIIDVHAAGVSKGNAARALQQELGKKHLVCVGDAHNDLPMLNNCDYAFCPADGIVAELYETVCPCAEGAVADVIYEKIPKILNIQP